MSKKQDKPAQDVMVPERAAPPAEVSNPIALWDSLAFSQMERVAERMARSSVLPFHLQVFRKKNGKIVSAKDASDNDEFDFEGTVGNCLAIINKARNWKMDPMAVAECTSFVHGRPCYEGKLIAAVIQQCLGIELDYEWVGVEGTDDYKIIIKHPDDENKMIEGTVKQWRTPQWDKNDLRKRLKYRGDREWCRMWAPALMLGVYTDDELQDLGSNYRAESARDVTPAAPGLADRLRQASTGKGSGFDEENIRKQIEAADHSDSEKGDTLPDADKKALAETEKSKTVAAKEVSEQPLEQKNLALESPSSQQGEQSPSEPLDDGGAEEASGADDSTPGVSSDILKDYSKALMRGEQEASLKSLHEQFWKGRTPIKDKKSKAKIEAVKEAHKQRVTSKITVAQMTEKLRQIFEAK